MAGARPAPLYFNPREEMESWDPLMKIRPSGVFDLVFCEPNTKDRVESFRKLLDNSGMFDEKGHPAGELATKFFEDCKTAEDYVRKCRELGKVDSILDSKVYEKAKREDRRLSAGEWSINRDYFLAFVENIPGDWPIAFGVYKPHQTYQTGSSIVKRDPPFPKDHRWLWGPNRRYKPRFTRRSRLLRCGHFGPKWKPKGTVGDDHYPPIPQHTPAQIEQWEKYHLMRAMHTSMHQKIGIPF